ncbi:squalene synthase HpnC [Methylophaga sp. UBA3593]|uniref:squalene synthase HpnC n=1 Tax=Methylophaga sp. UBA3593 TaxID=1946885 RepID=UPI0025CD0229|nr:squalene synthase HpnC [Methylophaga sp. UBA3593]
MPTNRQVQAAYHYCQQFARGHYENFPVASLLLPKKLRLPVAAIYTFARQADDIADEGDATATTRLQQLDEFHRELQAIANQNLTTVAPLWIALADSIQQHDLPVLLFADLLKAFRQDVSVKRYANLAEVLEYCRYSANPVGRLVLHLNNSLTDSQLHQSDCICTALQLINFFQDIEQDYLEKNRIYLPQDRLEAAGIDDSQLLAGDTRKLSVVLRPLYQYTMQLMQEGYQLGMTLTGRLGWEIRAMTLGGIEVLSLLIQQPDNELLSRPRLTKRQHLCVLINALSKRRYLARTNCLLQQKHLPF